MVLLLVEHFPVYTLGKNTPREHLLTKESDNISIIQTDRGGDITFHGPGQLVGYPILNLKDYKKDLHLYLRSIERSIIKSCIQYGVQASTKEGLTGVWCNDRKIASIGVGVRQWVSMHGFAINVNGDLSPFNEITPCGIQNAEMTNMETEIGGSINFKEFSDSVFENLIEELTLLSQN